MSGCNVENKQVLIP